MEKLIIIPFMICILHATPQKNHHNALQQNCLSCHQQQQIPSDLIYKRYLLKYSTAARIKAAMLSYLKHPTQEHSIMPSAFFVKFPMKQPVILDDTTLENCIDAYISAFSLTKKLR